MARISENGDARCSVVLTRQEYELLASGAASSIVVSEGTKGTVHLRVEDPYDASVIDAIAKAYA